MNHLLDLFLRVIYKYAPNPIGNYGKNKFYHNTKQIGFYGGGAPRDIENTIRDLYDDDNLPNPTITALDIGARAYFPERSEEAPKKSQQIHIPLRVFHQINKLDLHMIEADKEESSRLKKEFPEYTVHEKGVWETETTKFLNISRHTGWSSILEPNHKVLHEINNNNDHTVVKQIPVDVTTLNNLFGIKNFFDFIKIDVQGGEFQVLRGGNDLLNNTLLIETEVSFRPFYKDMKTFCEIKGLLETYGFILLDISDQLYNRKDGYSDGYASEYGELVHTDAIFINMRAIMRANVNRLFACICLLLNYNKISLAFFIIKENKSRINSKAYDSFIRILKNHANRNKSSGVIGIRI